MRQSTLKYLILHLCHLKYTLGSTEVWLKIASILQGFTVPFPKKKYRDCHISICIQYSLVITSNPLEIWIKYEYPVLYNGQ